MSCLSSWFAFYRSFLLWPSFNCWSLSGDLWITKAAASVPSRCQRRCTAAAWGLCVCGQSHKHISDQSLRRECMYVMGERHHRGPRPAGPIVPPTSALRCGNPEDHTCTNTVALLFFIDPGCCTDCCKYQTLYFSLLIIQYCNIFNIK